MTIGNEVTVVIDLGQEVASNTLLTIITCTLSSNGNSIDMIKDGLVPSYFAEMVKPLNSTVNREARFIWKIFQVGNLSKSNLSCKMKLESNQEPVVSLTDMF